MVNDRWRMMNSASELEEGPRHKPQRGCGYLLCSVLLFVAVLLVVTVTGVILLMHHFQIRTPLSLGGGGGLTKPPLVTTNQAEGDAPLVTVDTMDGSRLNVFLDPNCPDYNGHFLRLEGNFLRLEGVASTVLRSLAPPTAEGQDRALLAEGQDRALLAELAEEVGRLAAHAGALRRDNEALRRGQASMGAELGVLGAEQSRLGQLLADSQVSVDQAVRSVTEALGSLQKETMKTRPKADLQRAPVRDRRPRTCSNGSRPRDCSDLLWAGVREDGVYSVFPSHAPDGFQVYCDMTTDGGGWTVIQRREDGTVDFFRGWDAYRDGFGKVTGEHWLGLKRMHALTIQASYELRVDLEDFENATAFAQYASFGVGLFSVDPEEDGYPLTVTDYSGTAGDSLLKHGGMRFTTKDRDGDQSENNCAAFYQGAWWYRNCHTSNLNGRYLRGQHTSYADGVEWSSWTGWQYSLKRTEMKIRATAAPRDDSR